LLIAGWCRLAENCCPVLPSFSRVLIVAGLAVVLSACASPIAPGAPALGSPRPVDLGLTPPASPTASASPSAPVTIANPEQVKRLLQESARRHGVNPSLLMAVAWWESGWDQSKVSATGAIGIMQVEPATAKSAGPLLLHRAADIHDPADNIELGTAVLKEDLDHFNNDLSKALVAYYAGPAAVTDWKDQDAAAKRYVWGVYRLAVAFSNGTGPA
jgi:soluble lytic murein transglycosylase-like protein